jgi:hypothetical protein
MGRVRAGSETNDWADRSGVAGLKGEIGVGIACVDMSAAVPVEV